MSVVEGRTDLAGIRLEVWNRYCWKGLLGV